MATRLVSVTFDANEPLLVARFWAAALGWDIVDETNEHEIGLLPTDGTAFIVVFVPVPELKTEKNRLHLELVSESRDHQTEVVDRLVGAGARPVDVGQPADADHVVLADPEGNEFCVVVRSEFLASTGFLGAVAFEPAEPKTGRFWSVATGWSIVYDEGGDLALRAPSGTGPFLTFGPPGVPSKRTKNRVHLDTAPMIDDDQHAEVERLIRLGATVVEVGQSPDGGHVVLADPDGNEFCVLSPR